MRLLCRKPEKAGIIHLLGKGDLRLDRTLEESPPRPKVETVAENRLLAVQGQGRSSMAVRNQCIHKLAVVVSDFGLNF